MSMCGSDQPPQPIWVAPNVQPPQNYGGYPTEPPPNYQQGTPYVISAPNTQNAYILPNAQPGQTTYITTTTGNIPQQPQTTTTTTTTKFYRVAWLSQQQRNKPQSKSLSAGKFQIFYINVHF